MQMRTTHSPPEQTRARHARRTRRVIAALLTVATAAASLVVLERMTAPAQEIAHAPPASSRPLAVLGDSDSAGYQDRIGLPDPSLRGGPERARSLQWTEILARLRGKRLDLGPRTEVGGGRVHALMRWLRGRPARAHKFDHLHNFAASGWGCDSLLDTRRAQVPALLDLIERAPERWQGGVVVIRIGVNDFGQPAALERLAQDADDPQTQGAISVCLAAIERSVERLHARVPTLQIVLVGIFDNRHLPAQHSRWQSEHESTHVVRALDRFDQGLRALSAQRPRLHFLDERALFASLFGGRDAQGRPHYRPLRIGDFELRLSQGDTPEHFLLQDGHGGTLWNALWLNALLEILDEAPLEAGEMLGLIDGASLGTASPKP